MADADESRPNPELLQVAIVAWQALPAIKPETGKNIGGLETGAWRLARQLAQQPGIRSRIIVRSPTRMLEQVIDDVVVSPHCDRREYVRRDFASSIELGERIRIRRLSPKLLWQIPYLAATWPWRANDPPPMQPDPRLQPFSPDIWIALGASRESGGVIATASAQGKPSVLMIQSNADLDPRYVSEPDHVNAYGERGSHCHDAIARASVVVCQTDQQQSSLSKTFGRRGVVLRNATDPKAWSEAARQPGDVVLWVGRFDRFHKRPELAIEIARRCPNIPFRMIVNDSDHEVKNEIKANLPSNVQLQGYIPFDELPAAFGSSRIFLSTGNAEYEGFPTVLLHAAAAGKPIVSLDDFDGFIGASHAGVVCNDVPAAADAIDRYWRSPEQHDPGPAGDFLRANHSVETVTAQTVEVLRATIGEFSTKSSRRP